MPFYFAFQNRTMKNKVRRSFSFGNKSRKKGARNSVHCTGTTSMQEWGAKQNGLDLNEVHVCGNGKSRSNSRRHSLDSAVYHGNITPVAPLSASYSERRSSGSCCYGPAKPPRSSEKKLFTCELPECQKTEELLGIVAINFKACPACFTHYCSSKCRVAHWPLHKTVCHYGRITSYMKTIGETCEQDDDLRELFSTVAIDGYSDKGRGCVMLVLASPDAARLFIENSVGNRPTYASLSQIETSGVRTDHRNTLVRLITDYDPEFEFILNVAIVAERNLPPVPVPRNKEASVIKQFVITLRKKGECSKLNESFRRLSL